eukprot:scaffold2533_cov137-Cylindrotheca_fusiformis.AAC.6
MDGCSPLTTNLHRAVEAILPFEYLWLVFAHSLNVLFVPNRSIDSKIVHLKVASMVEHGMVGGQALAVDAPSHHDGGIHQDRNLERDKS